MKLLNRLNMGVTIRLWPNIRQNSICRVNMLIEIYQRVLG